ncbi:MAG TPA: gamma-glutamyltransferase, partial [Gammaproteobacteria bacterium]|nr:gamma-glutamyltransferase [Gammaproteobacteria bacterium]
ATLRSLAARGRKGFYHGQVARQLVEGVRAAGGIWTLADLRDYETRLREPITGTWRGWRITTAAPPSSGGIALLTMLNILEHDDLARLPAWQRVHLIVEAMRRAYRDRARYLGDPDFVSIPMARLIGKAYAKELRAGIDMNEATPSALLPGPGEAGHHTTHFSILDREGNRVAATLSINYPFGSGFVAPGTGVLLNDEMDDFSAKPGVPNVYGLVGAEANAIAPGKRMLSSMTPTFIESDRTLALFGTPGGSRIITMVLLGILSLEEGAGAGEVVARPRFHHQYLPDVIQYEPGAIGADVRTRLEAIGHRLAEKDPWGNMQIVVQDRNTGGMTAASDPRGEGQAQVR